MPVDATFVGEGHQWLSPGTDGLLYDHTDEELLPQLEVGELWFLPEHRDKDRPSIILYSVAEDDVNRV